MDDRSREAAPDLRGLSLALAAGLLAAHGLPRLLPLGLLLLLSLPAFAPWRGRALWGAAVLGLLLATLHGQQYLEQRWPAARHGEEVQLRGHIVSLPERSTRAARGGGEEATLRFEFAPETEGYPRRIRASWYRTEAQPRGGECWTLTLKLRSPHGSSDPGAFDYEAWLYRRGVGAVATVREGAPCELQGRRAAPVLDMREALRGKLDLWLGDHPGKALVAALTLGDTSGFSDADWQVYRETGTSHLVAISGFNVAILAGLAFLFIRWLWPLWPALALRLPAQKAALMASAAAGIAYGLLAGWESPVQRAALMLAVGLLAVLPDVRAQPSRLLAAALALLLLADPAVVLSPGLWLSFGAVAAIFYLGSGRLQAAPWWQTALLLQLMLSVVLAPLTLFFFDGAAWLGPWVNLLAVPAMVVLTPLVLLAVGLCLLAPEMGVPWLQGVAEVLVLGQQGLAWLAAHAPQPWFAASPPLAALLLALLGALILFAPRLDPLRPLALLCFLPLLWPPQAAVRGDFEVTALDVGQGLAVVVHTARHTLLYDAGPAFEEGFDAGESVVVPFVLGLGTRRIDRLLLSHGDSDHAGGVPAVRRLLDVANETGTEGHEPCRAGQAWDWDGVHFEVLHPAAEAPPLASDNNGSCVLRVRSPRFSVLLAGDIEKAAEVQLLQAQAGVLKADLLLAPHHGSKTSSTPEFIAAVAPELVVFSAGWRSHYGHPRPEVVARYRQAGARTLTTGVEGAVRVWREVDGPLQTTSWRRERPHFWNAPAEP